MDESTRKYNDERYDMWSTDGPGRVVGVFADERDITMCDWWHAYFFWKPQAKKQWHWNAKELSRLYGLHFEYAYYDVFYAGLGGPVNRWGGEAWNLKTNSLTEYPMSATISALYYRDVVSVHLKELSELQLECEELIKETGGLYGKKRSAEEKLNKLLPFGKATAREEKEKAEQEIPKMNALIDQKMARVEELRQLILKEQQNQ